MNCKTCVFVCERDISRAAVRLLSGQKWVTGAYMTQTCESPPGSGASQAWQAITNPHSASPQKGIV